MKAKCPTEYQEQVALVQWLKLKKIFHFAVVNENQQSSNNKFMAIKTAQKHKRAGRLSGVSDVIVMLPNKILFIELKRQTGSTTSKAQKEFLEKVNKYPYAVGKICKGASAAIEFIEENL